jgi:hypothetical protein
MTARPLPLFAGETVAGSPYGDTPVFSDDLFKALPLCLAGPSAVVEAEKGQRARDMFLLASIAAIGAALPAYMVVGHHKYFTDIFCAIAAPPASNKSIIEASREYVYPVADYYKELWRNKLEDWKLEAEAAKLARSASKLPDAPFQHYFFLPNSNTRPTLIYQLAACPVNLLITTEASSIFSSFASEHGNYKDILLACWGHEAFIEQKKSNNVRHDITRPRLAMVATTTPEQAMQLTGRGHDGMLSRFLVYAFQERQALRNPFLPEKADFLPPSPRSEAARFGGHVLERAQWPELQARFTDAQSAYLVGRLQALADRVEEAEAGAVRDATFKRAMVMAGRIATICAVLRAGLHQKLLMIDDCSFAVAVELSCSSLEHGITMAQVEEYRKPDKEPPLPPKPEKAKKTGFFFAIPQAFSREELLQLAEMYDVSPRTAVAWLNKSVLVGKVIEEKQDQFVQKNGKHN